MRIVYYVRPGNNEELRFSLRSVEANVPDAEVTVIGDHPDWLNIEALEFIKGNGLDPSTPEGKYGNALTNVRLAVHTYPGDFVVFNDDFMVLQPIVGPIPFYSRFSLANHIAQTPKTLPEYRYRKRLMSATKIYLSQTITDPLSYETHLPMPINGTRLWEEINRYWDWWGREEPLMWRTVYANRMLDEGTHVNRRDVLAHSPSELENALDFISTSDRSFDKLVDLLEIRFPDPSRWEL